MICIGTFVITKEQELKDSYKKLEELQRIANNWKVKYDSAVVNESVLTKDIPKALQSYRNELVVAWDKWDIDRRDKLIEELGKCEYSARALIFGFRNVLDGSTRI